MNTEASKKDKEVLPKTLGDKIMTAIGGIFCAFLIPILLINLVLIIKSYVNPNVVPDFLGYKPFIVLTGSMETTIFAGDLIVVKKVDIKDLKVDDIIAFREKDYVVTHRIYDIYTRQDGSVRIETKGDDNNTPDGNELIAEEVEGLYMFRIPKVGKFAVEFMQTPQGIILFVGVPIMIFLLVDYIRRAAYMKKLKAEGLTTEEELLRLERDKIQKELDELKKAQLDITNSLPDKLDSTVVKEEEAQPKSDND